MISIREGQNIQEALNAVRDAGGGEVIVESGNYKIAGLRVYSNTTLRLKSGVRLIGSDTVGDYPHLFGGKQPEPRIPVFYSKAVIAFINCENSQMLSDDGATIDGVDCYDPDGEEGFRGPMCILLHNSKNILLRGHIVERSANYSHFAVGCENLRFENIKVRAGHDGIHMWHCENIVIDKCDIRTGDDCIAGFGNRNLTVRNCYLNSSCNNFRIGARNLLVDNCDMTGPGEYAHRLCKTNNVVSGITHFAPATYFDPLSDEGPVPQDSLRPSGNWLFQNSRFVNTRCVLTYTGTLGGDLMEKVPLEDVRFENVQFTGLTQTAKVLAGNFGTIRITFDHCNIAFKEGAEELREGPDTPPCHHGYGVALDERRAVLKSDGKLELKVIDTVIEGGGTFEIR